jgi:hypothetical protein
MLSKCTHRLISTQEQTIRSPSSMLSNDHDISKLRTKFNRLYYNSNFKNYEVQIILKLKLLIAVASMDCL